MKQFYVFLLLFSSYNACTASVFRYLWQWDGRETEIMSRATDETGYSQPTLKQLVTARGKDMGGYHLNPVTAWVIKRDGQVLFKPEKWK